MAFADIDFETQSLLDRLVASGFDADSRAVFSWMGVTMYLTIDAIRTTLRAVASCAHGTEIMMTCNQPATTLDDLSRNITHALAVAIGDAGEPFISLFTPSEAQQLLRQQGLRDIRDYGPVDARRDYFQGHRDALIAGAQRILIGVVP